MVGKSSHSKSLDGIHFFPVRSKLLALNNASLLVLKMIYPSKYLMMALFATAFAASGRSQTQLEAEAYIELTRPIKLNAINTRIQRKTVNSIKIQQASNIEPIFRDKIKVRVKEPTHMYRTSQPISNNVHSLLDKVAFAIAKPTIIFKLMKFAFLTISSLLMSTIIFPLADISKTKVAQYNKQTNAARTNSDVDGIIDLMARGYEDTMRRLGFSNGSSCREHSLCTVGDMMASDFPHLVVFVIKIAETSLHGNASRNKYTKALLHGLNRTSNCDQAFKMNKNDCPSVKDSLKSFRQNGPNNKAAVVLMPGSAQL